MKSFFKLQMKSQDLKNPRPNPIKLDCPKIKNSFFKKSAWFDNCIGALNLRHFLSFLFVTLFAHAYTFFRVKHNKQIILDTLGHKIYVCTAVSHFVFFLPSRLFNCKLIFCAWRYISSQPHENRVKDSFSKG